MHMDKRRSIYKTALNFLCLQDEDSVFILLFQKVAISGFYKTPTLGVINMTE